MPVRPAIQPIRWLPRSGWLGLFRPTGPAQYPTAKGRRDMPARVPIPRERPHDNQNNKEEMHHAELQPQQASRSTGRGALRDCYRRAIAGYARYAVPRGI
ncbi:hypothetical protein STUTZSP0542_21380 [Stutzerimonas marianensis]